MQIKDNDNSGLAFLSGRLKAFGIRRTLGSVARHLNIGNLRDDYSVIKGIHSGRFAFRGPLFVQIDLSDECNNDCICCWSNSPFIKDSSTIDKDKQHLSYTETLKIIDELKNIGTREITLSGGGEPFMHPRLLDIIEHIKRNKIRCQLNTNFTLATRCIIRRLLELKLDVLIVSLWAADPETYQLLHPNKKESDFNQIRDNLIYLSGIKKKNKIPHVHIRNVINSLNYSQIRQMADFACQLKADEVSFAVMDAVAPATDSLLLNDEQRQTVLMACRKLSRNTYVSGLDEFSSRITAKGASSGKYDASASESMPCYSGWLFARIKADGNVNPCLKAHRISVGNIYQQDFKDLWNSRPMQEFRERSVSFEKTHPYFLQVGNGLSSEIGCYRVCDNLLMNKSVYRKLCFSPVSRMMAAVVHWQRQAVNPSGKVTPWVKIIYLFVITIGYSVVLKIYQLTRRMTIFPGE